MWTKRGRSCFWNGYSVAELLARGENEAADKLDKENRANLEDFMRNHVGGLCDADVEEVLEEYAYNTLK